MEEIVLIIDTSVLRKHSSRNTPEFELVSELSRINAIKFKIPEMVDKEFLSQQLEEVKNHYDNIISSFKRLKKKINSTNIQFDAEIKRFEKEKIIALKQIEKDWIKYRREKNISIIPFSLTATNKVFSDYFKGNPPFKNIKNRNDIPDAFILHSILALTNKDNIHVVSTDNGLSISVLKNNIKTHESLSDFLDLPEIKSKIKELEDLSSLSNEFELIKSNEAKLFDWVCNHIKNSIPIELYNSSGAPSKHKDKLVKLYKINSVNFDFNKARLYDSRFLVIPSTINVSIELEMIYSHEEYFKLSKTNMFQKMLELLKQKENEEGVIIIEPFTGGLNLSLKFDMTKPFVLKNNNISYSEITKDLLISDMLNDISKY